MTDLEDLLSARYRLARVYGEAVCSMMNDIERERDVDLLPHGLAVHAAWEKFCKADQAYWRARKKEGAAGDES